MKANYSSPLPAHQVCPLCGRDDRIEVTTIADSLWRYTCASSSKNHPFSWMGSTSSEPDDAKTENKADELGLYHDLPLCLVKGEPFVEYGVVEHRFSLLRPQVFDQLVEDYGHTRQGPKKYTASAFIAKTLGTLFDRGVILYRDGSATGRWSYNSGISHWALPPGPSDPESILTYEQYCLAQGIDPSA
jgi:hypothetical protein